jgi:uncharacterized protein (TIGR02246 family)
MLGIAVLACLFNGGPPVGGDREAVRAVLERFEAAWNRGDVDAMVMTYTDPHVDVNDPDQIVTREETRAMLAALHPGRRYRIEISSDEVVVEGDLAFQRGSFVLTPTPEMAAEGGATIAKRYLEILRRAEDGEWRVWWSMDAPIVP